MDSVADELLTHYVLFCCEGTAEGVVIERLVDEGKLIVDTERIVKDPITFKPFTRARKARDIEARFFGQDFAVEGARGLLLARVVDSRRAKFVLSRVNRDSALVRTFITAPEIEMLVIHAENAYEDWLRKSRKDRQLMPSEYCIRHLGFNAVKSEEFLREYWNDVDRLTSAIRAYASKTGKRKTEELMLTHLLK